MIDAIPNAPKSSNVQKGRISKRTVDLLSPPLSGETRFWDDRLTGFFVRVYPTGRKVYAVKCRVHGKQVIGTIGTHGAPWTPESAREKASEMLSMAAKGFNPSEEKISSRRAITVNDLIELYLRDGPITKPNKRQVSWQADESNLRRHVSPQLGSEAANSVTKLQAGRAIQKIREGATAYSAKSGKARGLILVKGGDGVARRALSVVSAMYRWGMKHEHVTVNPFAELTLGAAPAQERFLTIEEVSKYLSALRNLEDCGQIKSAYADALRLLLLTGARKTEIAHLKWSEVSLERNRLELPADRTKAGGKNGKRNILLMPAASAILEARLRNIGSTFNQADYVFPSAKFSGPVVGLRKIHMKVCAEAGLAGLRVHDLRHTFASIAISDGQSMLVVSKLLGHANLRSTERYVHLEADPLRNAVQSIGERIGQ